MVDDLATQSEGHSRELPKYERAYRAILARLKEGRYPVGGRVPTEVELAEHFSVSRVTIRRATRSTDPRWQNRHGAWSAR